MLSDKHAQICIPKRRWKALKHLAMKGQLRLDMQLAVVWSAMHGYRRYTSLKVEIQICNIIQNSYSVLDHNILASFNWVGEATHCPREIIEHALAHKGNEVQL